MRPLEGIRVLDLSRLLPGGFCTMVLADLGAEVVKVEEPGRGDGIRSYAHGGRAVFFDALHRGKRSLTLDLRAPEGRDLLLRLAKCADVLVEGFRPGTLARLGLCADALQAANPRLIICSITGYGQSGDLSGRAGHDLNYLAEAGALAFASPSPGGRPALPPVTAADLGTGALTAVAAVLAALLERHRTGRGAVLDIGMAPGLLSWLALPVAEYLETGSVAAGGEAALQGGLACYEIYPTADGRWLTLAALEPKFWARLCQMLGHPEWEEWHLHPGRQAGLRRALEAIFVARTLAEWEAFFGEADVCVAPVRSLDEALARWPGRLRQVVGNDGRPSRIAAGPIGEVASGAAPALGADTDALLETLGIDAAERQRLRERRVI
jgi:crotonobetainyl-CoA:carnitine CoA-transferase CaiB-like acyl-CoA transferase